MCYSVACCVIVKQKATPPAEEHNKRIHNSKRNSQRDCWTMEASRGKPTVLNVPRGGGGYDTSRSETKVPIVNNFPGGDIPTVLL